MLGDAPPTFSVIRSSRNRMRAVHHNNELGFSALYNGAQREGRTPTLLREPDFESGASASSAIRAYPHSLHHQADLFLTCHRPRVNRQLSPLPNTLRLWKPIADDELVQASHQTMR